jgi:Recombinase zinc beta ribbon domain
MVAKQASSTATPLGTDAPGLVEIICAECGGRMRIVGSKAGEAKRIGCSNARHKGVCANSKSYNLAEIETLFLDGTKKIDPEALAAFTKGVHKEWAARQRAASTEREAVERAINRATERIDRISTAIADLDGGEVPPLMEKLKALVQERAGLRTKRELIGDGNVVTLLPETIRNACTNLRSLADLLAQAKTVEEAAPYKVAIGNHFEAIEVHQTGKRRPVEITPHMRVSAMMGVPTMSRMQSSKEVLEEQGVTSVVSSTHGTLEQLGW